MEKTELRLVTPELDERRWLAWKEKNRVKDQIWAAQWRRTLTVLVALAAIALIAAYWTGIFA